MARTAAGPHTRQHTGGEQRVCAVGCAAAGVGVGATPPRVQGCWLCLSALPCGGSSSNRTPERANAAAGFSLTPTRSLLVLPALTKTCRKQPQSPALQRTWSRRIRNCGFSCPRRSLRPSPSHNGCMRTGLSLRRRTDAYGTAHAVLAWPAGRATGWSSSQRLAATGWSSSRRRPICRRLLLPSPCGLGPWTDTTTSSQR